MLGPSLFKAFPGDSNGQTELRMKTEKIQTERRKETKNHLVDCKRLLFCFVLFCCCFVLLLFCFVLSICDLQGKTADGPSWTLTNYSSSVLCTVSDALQARQRSRRSNKPRILALGVIRKEGKKSGRSVRSQPALRSDDVP